MKPNRFLAVSAGAATILAIAGGFFWLFRPLPNEALRTAKAGEGSVRRVVGALSNGGILPTTFSKGSGLPGITRESWPMFRGGDGENHREPTVPLAVSWPQSGPSVRWKVAMGEGYAGAAVVEGRVFVLDYDEQNRKDALRCLSFADGREIWRRSYPLGIKRNHGISRTVCAVGNGVVVSLGPKCHVMACDVTTGDLLWFMDMVGQQGTQVPLWYTGQCPLMDGNTVVLAPGGKDLMLGVDTRSGKVLWRTPNPGKWQMSHASITRGQVSGKNIYLYPSLGGTVAVFADGPTVGQVAISTTQWDASVLAPSAVVLPGSRIFLTAGYGIGSMVLAVDGAPKSLGKISKEDFACEQQTPVRHGNLLFTVMTADAGQHKGELACRDMSSGIGAALWYSGPDDRFGLGPFLRWGDRMLLLDDGGTLTVARVSAKGYERLARHRVLTGRDAWGPMALVDGFLILRDLKEMICLDLRGPV